MPTKSEIASPWYRYGTDKQFLAWLRKQASAASGRRDGIVPAHYRTAFNSGIAIKPVYSAIPLTNDEHMEQHRIGQYSFRPREWWEHMVRAHLEAWARSVQWKK